MTDQTYILIAASTQPRVLALPCRWFLPDELWEPQNGYTRYPCRSLVMLVWTSYGIFDPETPLCRSQCVTGDASCVCPQCSLSETEFRR